MFSTFAKNRIYLLLFLIVLFGGILRFYKISQVPPSLYWDEISSAYNAYSIEKTGKDEFGNSFPLLFRAFEDYKTPANIYLTATAVKLFGLNEFSARFTSAFLGTFTVLLAFFLVLEIFTERFRGIDSNYLALLSSFFMAISPWNIQFSRTGFEANVGLFFVVLGVLLFFRFIRREKPNNLYLSFTVFSLSIYFYRSIWVFVPLLILSALFVYRKFLFSRYLKQTIFACLIFFIILSPFIPVMISKQGQVRIQQVNVVDNSQQQIAKYVARQKSVKGEIGKVVFNRRIAYAQEIARGYLAHFSQTFLFFQGDGNGRHGVKGFGVLYLWAAILIVPGIIALFKLDKKTRNLMILWVLIAPIPAAVSVPAPHALRSLNMSIAPQIILALGVGLIMVNLKKYQRYIFALVLSFLILFFLARYLYGYFGPNANLTSSQWGDGYKQLTQYVFANEGKYDKIVISGHFWQPYVYFLFYKKYDPVLFQKNGSKKGFDKYLFGGTSWDMNGKELGDMDLSKFAGTRNFLVALSPVEYNLQKDNVNVETKIRNHNNEIVFIIGTLR